MATKNKSIYSQKVERLRFLKNELKHNLNKSVKDKIELEVRDLTVDLKRIHNSLNVVHSGRYSCYKWYNIFFK
jgi:ABC-type phosphate transport system auxiliary subunit